MPKVHEEISKLAKICNALNEQVRLVADAIKSQKLTRTEHRQTIFRVLTLIHQAIEPILPTNGSSIICLQYGKNARMVTFDKRGVELVPNLLTEKNCCDFPLEECEICSITNEIISELKRIEEGLRQLQITNESTSQNLSKDLSRAVDMLKTLTFPS